MFSSYLYQIINLYYLVVCPTVLYRIQAWAKNSWNDLSTISVRLPKQNSDSISTQRLLTNTRKFFDQDLTTLIGVR